MDSVDDPAPHVNNRSVGSTWLTLLATDLGIKKKKKKPKAKEGDDDFAAKLAALDLDKEGGDAAAEEQAQDGDMLVSLPGHSTPPWPRAGRFTSVAGATKHTEWASHLKVTHTDKISFNRKVGTGIWKHDDTTPIKYDLLLVCRSSGRVSV